MAYLNTYLVSLLLFCLSWLSDGKAFFTYLGTKCIEDCKVDGGEYKCKTIDKDGKYQTMYCSPQENVDYWGRECSSVSWCGKSGDYFWCRIDAFRWGYCGLVMDDKDHYVSYYGSLCYDCCDQRNQGYYWCHTTQGWDYCSPSENTDYNNKQCKDDSPCGKHGEKYSWCWLKEGSWGYCGHVEPKMLFCWSKYNKVCMDECQYYEYGKYYWCHTANGWDYCSPDIDVTYKDKPCRSDHSCGSHDYKYNWCWTSVSDYDYCGPLESEECTYFTPTHRNRIGLDDKNQIFIEKDRQLICTCIDKCNKRITTFTSEPAPNDITDGSRLTSEAQTLISRWNNGYLVDQARSNLLRSQHLRIDMQGPINRNNQFYYNLQMQLNEKRGPGQSTTVSQILVPRGVPDRYIRRAFVESFNRRARVLVEVSRLNQC